LLPLALPPYPRERWLFTLLHCCFSESGIVDNPKHWCLRQEAMTLRQKRERVCSQCASSAAPFAECCIEVFFQYLVTQATMMPCSSLHAVVSCLLDDVFEPLLSHIYTRINPACGCTVLLVLVSATMCYCAFHSRNPRGGGKDFGVVRNKISSARAGLEDVMLRNEHFARDPVTSCVWK
jgi:hypothetical protein